MSSGAGGTGGVGPGGVGTGGVGPGGGVTGPGGGTAMSSGAGGTGGVGPGGGGGQGGGSCGDAIVEGAEACDDGNSVENDGCSATCRGPNLVELDCGAGNNCCARDKDGAITCWGETLPAALPTGAGWKAVDAVLSMVAGLDPMGQPKVFGELAGNACKTSNAPAVALESLSLGVWGACGLKADGTMVCWGGQCGANCNASGQFVAEQGTFSQVSTHSNSSCAIDKATKALKCWGCNDAGQLNMPQVGEGWKFVAVRNQITAGITTSGAAYVWGQNAGAGSPPADTYRDVGCEPGPSCCGVGAGGKVRCWGQETLLNMDAPAGAFEAVEVVGYVGVSTACALTAGGAVRCWGNSMKLKDVPMKLRPVCTPGKATCLGNVAGVCNDAGSGFDSGMKCEGGPGCFNGVCQ